MRQGGERPALADPVLLMSFWRGESRSAKKAIVDLESSNDAFSITTSPDLRLPSLSLHQRLKRGEAPCCSSLFLCSTTLFPPLHNADIRLCWGYRVVMPQQRTPGPPPRQGMLNIITFGEPQESTSVRAIRSHAAKAGWKSRKNSKTLAAAAKNAVPGSIAEVAPAAAQLAPPRHGNLPAVPSWPEHDTARSIVPPLASPSLPSPPSTNSSDSSPSSTHSPRDTAMVSMTDDCGFAKSGSNDDEEDTDHVNYHALQLMSKESIDPRSTAIARPHQLGSTHDPFSQFPVRWEESFGPLIHFCKYLSHHGLSGGRRARALG